jgi:hypothetical protein
MRPSVRSARNHFPRVRCRASGRANEVRAIQVEARPAQASKGTGALKQGDSLPLPGVHQTSGHGVYALEQYDVEHCQ